MAARFWIGGTGNWDASTTTHWSTTSGGSGGAAVPTSSDDVTFDANSGATATVTITAAANANSITINKSDLTLTHTAGSTVVGTVTLTTGTLNTNGQTCSWGLLSASGTSTRTLTLGASAITITGITGNVWDTTTTTGMTFNANTSSITIAGNGTAGNTAAMNTGNLTYNTVIFATSGTNQLGSLSGSNPTIANLTVTGSATSSAIFSLGTNVTVTTALTLNGSNANTNRLMVKSTSIGTQQTITNNGTGTFSNLDLQDIAGAGSASWNLAAITGNSGDCLGNSGITFTAPRSLFWTGNTGNWSGATKWSLTSGGTANQINPLAQDSITFDSHSFNGASQIVTCDMPRAGTSIDFTNATNNPTLTLNAGAPQSVRVYGSVTLIAGMTQNGGGVLQFEGRGSSTLTTANVAFAEAITVNAPGGTVTLNGNLITPSSANGFNHLAGTFTVNNGNLTLSRFVSGGTLTRAFNMGSGTWTLTGTAFVWNISGSGLTLNAQTSTLVINDTSATSKTLSGNSFTYNIITITGDNVTLGGSNTIATLNINNAGLTNGGLKVTSGSTQTITGTITTNGSAGNLATLASTASATTLTKTSGTVSVDYMNISNSHATGGAKYYAGAHSTDGGGNTGWIFTAPPGWTGGWGIPIQ